MENTSEYEYKVVRSYGPDSNGKTKDLEEAFKNGYEFVRASEYVNGEYTYSGYIEYILRRKKP